MTSVEETLVELASQIAALRDREDIREVLHRYCRATDRFAEHVLGPTKLGALADVRHYITKVMIGLDGDRAFVESSFLCAWALELSGGRAVNAQSEGRYLDLFEQRAGDWKIFRRVMFSQKLVWSPQPDQPGGMPALSGDFSHRYPDDPVYRGFELAGA